MKPKIKFIFIGPNQVLKKPTIVNNTLCVYLDKGKNYLYAKKNEPVLDLLLTSATKSETINFVKLLNTEGFYDFLRNLNLSKYSVLLRNQNINSLESIDFLITDFEKWNKANGLKKEKVIEKTRKVMSSKIITEFKRFLEIKYPKEIKYPRSTKKYSKPKVK